VKPESVGNARVIPVSDQSGRSNVLARLAEAGIAIDPKDDRVAKLLDAIKTREYQGYAYDGAEASFELLARRTLGQVPQYFDIETYKVTVERKNGVTISEGTVQLDVGGQKLTNVGRGNGPVNALDAALRADLGKYSTFLADLRLVDYKVRILTSGTEAVTRVMVESVDGKGRRWSTVGVSENIVDASFEALTDSIIYKLYRDGAKV
jgi:2-isopropylmalate synthase